MRALLRDAQDQTRIALEVEEAVYDPKDNKLYYDSEDLASLATEAKNDGYSLLKYAMPKLDEDQEFTPDRIMTILKNYEKAEWVFSRLEQHWKQVL